MKREATLLHELVLQAAHRAPQSIALIDGTLALSYGELAHDIERFAAALQALGVRRGDRIAIYLDKRREAVVASFGAPAQGAVFVPINPLFKPGQIAHILRDCGVRVLVTSGERFDLVASALSGCSDLAHVILVDGSPPTASAASTFALHGWDVVSGSIARKGHRVIDIDVAAILYTSGSTGLPKGVVLSHRNMVAGAVSVASYLDNRDDDVLLAALPLSFDAGFSQLTTAFHVGARVVLLNYLLPQDVVSAVAAQRVTGLTAVPPLWIQLARVSWPLTVHEHLRYIANTGGRMPFETLSSLRAALPQAKPYLMYGLTEAFRATYLPPDEVDRRPDSIGKAIPNAEILVLRADGTPCAPNEPGELVQRGALVAMGYWNDPQRTAERFRPLPGRDPGLVLVETAVFSGDTVRMDDDGFLYFIGRDDEMIKSSGYRISPVEVEEVLYASRLVAECAAFGVPHAALGQAVAAVVTAPDGMTIDKSRLLAACRESLPAYMVPAHLDIRAAPLPRNPNGKIDRKRLASELQQALGEGVS